MNPYSILLIDNDPGYCTHLVEDAKRFRLLVTYVHNLEEGMMALKINPRFKAVILDDRCVLDGNQVGEGKSNFVIRAILELGDFEHSFNRIVPYCVNCESKEEFSESYDGVAQLFTKRVDHEKMFQWLQGKIEQLREIIIS